MGLRTYLAGWLLRHARVKCSDLHAAIDSIDADKDGYINLAEAVEAATEAVSFVKG